MHSCTSLRAILSRDFVVYVFYVETVPVPQTISRQNHCEDQCRPWRPADLPPYHHPYLVDTQTKCIDVIPTLWVMPHALGLGVLTTQDEYFALLERAFYRDFL